MVEVDVIIRTTAEKNRRESLQRAIDSVLAQEHVSARPIIVANGNRYDPETLQALAARKDVLFTHFEPGSAGRAILVGRSLVTAPYFAFLDDDDELMPLSIWKRLQPFTSSPDADLVVSNGYFASGGDAIRVDIENFERCQADPLIDIIDRCWLSSCGGLFKKSSFSQEFFSDDADYLEWTLLAFRIAQKKYKIVFINELLYKINNTRNSLSKTVEYSNSWVGMLEVMRNYELPQRAKRLLERKYRNALHIQAKHLHEDGKYLLAWQSHLRSLLPPHTLRFILFTRKILFPVKPKRNG